MTTTVTTAEGARTRFARPAPGRHPVLRFTLGRLAFSVLAVLVVTLVVFFSVRLVPGDPILAILGPTSTPEQRALLTSVMGLDRPLTEQFWIWLANIAKGDLGFSYSQGRAVSDLVGDALRMTLGLAGLGIVFALAIGLLVGNAGSARAAWPRRVSNAIEAFVLSVPQYTVALLLLIFLGVVLHVAPAGGINPNPQASALDQIPYLILPAFALGLLPGAAIGRSFRTALQEPQLKELRASLEGRGYSDLRVLGHLHHNALPSVVTVIAIQAGAMLGGAVFIETIFGLPGLGRLLVGAISGRDYLTMQGAAACLALLTVMILLLGDLVRITVDVRARRGVR